MARLLISSAKTKDRDMTFLILTPKNASNYHSHDGTPSESERELTALRGTAIDAGKFPILIKHWRGPLIVAGRLACNDDSPLAHRFKTRPMNGAKGAA